MFASIFVNICLKNICNKKFSKFSIINQFKDQKNNFNAQYQVTDTDQIFRNEFLLNFYFFVFQIKSEFKYLNQIKHLFKH